MYFNENFGPAGEETLAYSNISFGGYENECRTEHYLYLNPKGPTGVLDAGTVLQMDPAALSFERYAIDRINITSFTSDEEYIYTLSNLNQVTCADRLSVDDSELATVTLENIYLDSAAVIDGKLYTFAYGDNDLCALCRVDFDRGEVEMLADLDSRNPPCFLIAYGKKLLFTYSGLLQIYDTQTGLLQEKPLGDERAYNLSLTGDILAIGYTSILSVEDSRVELYDLKEEKSICQFDHPGSILQIEMPRPWDGKVYVLGYDDLTVYSVGKKMENGTEGSEAAVVNTLSLEPEDAEYCGGFVLLG